jgi:hypothetical protein
MIRAEREKANKKHRYHTHYLARRLVFLVN